MGVARFIGQAIFGFIGFAAFAVFLVIGLDLIETGQWPTGRLTVVIVSGIVALFSLGVASRIRS